MIKTLLIVAVFAYAALAAFAWFTADRQIFFPPPPSYTLSSIGATRVGTADGAEIAVVHLPHRDAQITILYSHGNAEDLGHALPFLEELRRRGFAVIGYDYRGYGMSSGGPPTAAGSYHDIEAVYEYATGALGIAPDRLVLFGRSVGSGPATWLASKRPVGGLILENAFTSAFVVVTRVTLLPFDRYPNLTLIPKVEAPVLVIHAVEDEVIPLHHGRSLYEAAQEPKRHLWVERARHNDTPHVGGEVYWRALHDFVQLVQRRQ